MAYIGEWPKTSENSKGYIFYTAKNILHTQENNDSKKLINLIFSPPKQSPKRSPKQSKSRRSPKSKH